MRGDSEHLKKLLIQKGIVQLTVYGMEHFSLREVAKSCDVSCAAPFKHFKDRGEYFREISGYLDQLLLEHMEKLSQDFSGNLELIFQENSYAYIEYLVSHPFLMNLSFWNDMGHEQCMGIREWKSLTHVIQDFRKYCMSLDMPEEEYRRVYYLMQNLTYGTAFMATSGMLSMTEDYSIRLRESMKRLFLPYRHE